MPKSGWGDLVRPILLVCVCLAGLALLRHGFGPRTRAVTVLAIGIMFAMAVIYELAARGLSEQIMVLAIALVAGVCAVFYGVLQIFDPATPQWRGPLLAGDLSAPANGCRGRPELGDARHLLMIFGQDGVIGEGNGPFVPVRIGSCPALSLKRVRGGLVVDGFGYDADNNVVYRVRDNRFEMVLRGFLTEDRSEKNKLKIVDENSRAWLTVSYLNTNTVKITGIFGCGDTKSVTVGEDAVRIGGAKRPAGVCRVLGAGSKGAIVYQKRAD